MTTIGYGDYGAYSHMGRLIAVVIAFWGVFYLSLFVVALSSIFSFDSPESRAFMLLSRLSYKEKRKEEAVGMVNASYRKLMLDKKIIEINAKLEEKKITEDQSKRMIKSIKNE